MPVRDLEQLGKQMLRRGDAGRRVHDLAGLFLRQLDQLRHRLGRQRRRGHQQERIVRDERDRREVLVRVERRLLVERRRDRQRAAAAAPACSRRAATSRAPGCRSPRRRPAGSRSRSMPSARSASLAPMMRASTSLPPPAGNGEINADRPVRIVLRLCLRWRRHERSDRELRPRATIAEVSCQLLELRAARRHSPSA